MRPEGGDAERIWRATGAPGSIAVLSGLRPWAPIEEALRDLIAAEREACARLMDAVADEEHANAGKAFGTPGEQLAMLALHTAQRGAAAIRARGGA